MTLLLSHPTHATVGWELRDNTGDTQGGHRQGHLGLCYPRVTNTCQRHFGESPVELKLLNTTSTLLILLFN